MRIREMSEEYRPREKMMRFGVKSLNDAELLAVLLQTGCRGRNVVDMCMEILNKDIEKCSLKELNEVKGMGMVKACKIKAAVELGLRKSIKGQKIRISCAEDVFKTVREKFLNLKKEMFCVLHLDTKNKIVSEETISIGILNSSLIHPREVFCNAIREHSNSIILVHNHPSGDSEPSEEDREVTKILLKGAQILDISILDHVIIGDGFYSFKENGIL